MFSGVERGCIENKWVNITRITIIPFSLTFQTNKQPLIQILNGKVHDDNSPRNSKNPQNKGSFKAIKSNFQVFNFWFYLATIGYNIYVILKIERNTLLLCTKLLHNEQLWQEIFRNPVELFGIILPATWGNWVLPSQIYQNKLVKNYSNKLTSSKTPLIKKSPLVNFVR